MSHIYELWVYDGRTGTATASLKENRMDVCERKIAHLLSTGNAIEFREVVTDNPISNFEGDYILTDSDGFCGIYRRRTP